MRLVQELVELLEQKRTAAEISEAASAFIAIQLPPAGQIDMLQRLSGPQQSYAAATRAQLRQMGYGELCVLSEQVEVVA